MRQRLAETTGIYHVVDHVLAPSQAKGFFGVFPGPGFASLAISAGMLSVVAATPGTESPASTGEVKMVGLSSKGETAVLTPSPQPCTSSSHR